MIAFKAPKDVLDLLQNAKEATGESVSQIVMECIRAQVDSVVERIDLRRQAGMEKFKSGTKSGRVKSDPVEEN